MLLQRHLPPEVGHPGQVGESPIEQHVEMTDPLLQFDQIIQRRVDFHAVLLARGMRAERFPSIRHGTHHVTADQYPPSPARPRRCATSFAIVPTIPSGSAASSSSREPYPQRTATQATPFSRAPTTSWTRSPTITTVAWRQPVGCRERAGCSTPLSVSIAVELGADARPEEGPQPMMLDDPLGVFTGLGGHHPQGKARVAERTHRVPDPLIEDVLNGCPSPRIAPGRPQSPPGFCPGRSYQVAFGRSPPTADQ